MWFQSLVLEAENLFSVNPPIIKTKIGSNWASRWICWMCSFWSTCFESSMKENDKKYLQGGQESRLQSSFGPKRKSSQRESTVGQPAPRPVVSSPSTPAHDKTNKMTCTSSEDSDQPGHPPSLIRVFAVRMKKAWVLCYPLSAQRRLWSDWADAQADLSLRLAHMPFCWFCHEAAQVR